MNTTNATDSTAWEGPTWRIYGASAGLEQILSDGRPSAFRLHLSPDGSSYTMEAVSPDGLPSSFQPTSAFTPAGVVSTAKLQLESQKSATLEKLASFSPSILPAPADGIVQQYWDVHKLVTSQPQLPNFMRLEGTARFCGEDHYVDLYKIGDVLSDPDKVLLVMRFLTIEDDSNSDGWAVGNN
jgi:hypothetical protein